MRGDIFKYTQHVRRPYNYFDLSHSVKSSFKLAQLVPTLQLECLPGDRLEIAASSLVRFMPLVSPVMHKFNITHHFFFVPNRLLWDDWDDFISGNGSFTHPYADGVDSLAVGDLGDYMGIPIGMPSTEKVNALPIAAYEMIRIEYYEDSQIGASTYSGLAEGDNSWIQADIVAVPRQRSWGHDYFTSARSYPQSGSTTTVLPVTHSGDDPTVTYDPTTGTYSRFLTMAGATDGSQTMTLDANSRLTGTTSSNYLMYDPKDSLYVDLASDQGTIRDLREAIKLQEFLEKDSVSGLRYAEQLYARWGVRSKDARLDRPEYIGGSKSTVVVSEVLSSAETIDFDSTDVISPIGSMAGKGMGVTEGNKFKYFCDEYGWIMCITSVMPENDYYQGLHRQWSRDDRLDYYFHEFALIGEQAILTKEIYAEGTQNSNDTEFGYAPKYSEYKFLNNRICGELRTSLDHWHLARQFSSAPTLNDTFLTCTPDTRIFADTDGGTHHIIAHIFFNIGAYRQMPKYGNPSI